MKKKERIGLASFFTCTNLICFALIYLPAQGLYCYMSKTRMQHLDLKYPFNTPLLQHSRPV